MIYIQSNTEETLPHHFDAACALYGAINIGIDYKLVSYEWMMKLKLAGTLINLAKIHTFVGSVEFMKEIWDTLGKSPKIINSNRKCYIEKLWVVKNKIINNNDERIFVKPVQTKLFTGLVLDKYSISCLKDIPDNTDIMVYQVIDNIKSEWRLYVHNGKIVDSKNYSGDFKIGANYSYAELVIKKYKHVLPCAYTIDLGQTPDNWLHHSHVIEFNDMWAIGNYGIDNELYLGMLKDRYNEIIRYV